MNEVSWLTCTDPDAMLRFLRGRASERKLRLVACACVRRIWAFLPDDRVRQAVEVVERCADGLARRAALQAALADAEAVEAASTGPARAAARAVVAAWSTAEHACSAAAQASPDPTRERRHQADLLRDLVGNPFRSVPVELPWLERNGGAVAQVARTIYDGRRFADLPVLADALEENGCTNEAILTHCRSGAEHALGCWVLDSLLGTPVVAETPDKGLIPWTVCRRVEQRGRYSPQAGGRPSFAAATLRIEPHTGPAPVVFLNATRAGRDSQAWVPAVEEGIRQFVAAQAEQGKRAGLGGQGRDDQAVGLADRQGVGLPQGAHSGGAVRGLQARRQDAGLGERGQDDQAVGRLEGGATVAPRSTVISTGGYPGQPPVGDFFPVAALDLADADE